MIRNNLSWINLNAGSSGGSGGGGVSDYNDLANRPIISMTGTSQNPLKLWNLSTGLYLLNGYVYYDITNIRETVNLFVSITAQIQNGKYVLSAFVPSWEGHYEYIKANSTSTEYTDTQILKMLTEDDVLTLTNEVEYTPTTDYHPSTKKYVDEAMQSVMEEFAKMGVNEQDIKTLIAENRRRDIAIQALLNETADKNVTIEEDTHTISLDYSMEDGMATVNSIEGSTLVNVSKTVDEVYVTKSQDRVEQTKVANTIGEQNGKLCPIIEGDTLVNVCDQKEPIAITKSYTVENSGNHIALQGEYDGSCRPVIQGNTIVNLVNGTGYIGKGNYDLKTAYTLKADNTYTVVVSQNVINDEGIRIGFLNDARDKWVDTTNNYATIDNSKDSYILYSVKPILDTNYLRIQCKGVDTSSTVTVDHIINYAMVFEGDLTQTPELIPTEYVEGLKSSFEDNVVTQAMVDNGEESVENLGKYKVEYKVIGKNKFNTTWKNLGDDRLVTNNTIHYKKDTKYTLTIPNLYNTLIQTGHSVQIYLVSNNNTIYTDPVNQADLLISNWKNFDNYTFEMPKEGDFYLQIRGSRERILEALKTNKVQLEEGAEATEYETYKEYTKTFYLNSPLLEGDTIEDINGVATHVKRWKQLSYEDIVPLNLNHLQEYDTIIIKNTSDISPTGWNENVCISTSTFRYNTPGGVPYLALNNASNYGITDMNLALNYMKQHKVVYKLASPIREPISDESILCDSYVNGHLDFDSAVPIEKVEFIRPGLTLKYLKENTKYIIQFKSDNIGTSRIAINGNLVYIEDSAYLDIVKGINRFKVNYTTSYDYTLYFNGIGFNVSNIVVTEATDKEFDYFNGIQSTFEENLVTDENNPHYGKYRVIYRTKSSDGNASTVKSVYLNSPLLQGDKLVVVNGKLCHYHKMGKVVLDGSEDWRIDSNYIKPYFTMLKDNYPAELQGKNLGVIYSDNLIGVKNTDRKNKEISIGNSYQFAISVDDMVNTNDYLGSVLIFKQWLQANPTTVVYQLASPYYEEISSNPKDTIVDFYANGTLEVQSAVYPLSMEFTSFEEELTYLYASTVYTVQFETNGNAIANITLGGTTVTNQEITHGLNKIQVTTPSTLIDNKLIIDGCGDCKISKVVVTNSTEEFEYFEGMKSAFEDKQNEDGTYTVEIVVYNAPIRLNKDKE